MITILGSTGTIGINTLSVISNLKKSYPIFALTANKNIRLLFKQIKKYKPVYAVISNENDAIRLRKLCKTNDIKIKILFGRSGLLYVTEHIKVKNVLSAIVGAAALEPTINAIKNSKNILLANKESLIMSGSLMIKLARKSGSLIIPVDSEHNAILQIMSTHGLEYTNNKSLIKNNINHVTLTASGGPFLNFTKKQLLNVSPSEAVKHPKWKMGKKISVDSATMMNKGLEIIEASILFDLDPKQIKVLIHPESIVHALVSFTDGSVISHMSKHDMRVAISYAISWPYRQNINIQELKNIEFNSLSFRKVKKNQFKCLDLCIKALKLGHNAPTVLNAANEIAVSNFLENKIKFLDIPVIIDYALKNMKLIKNNSLKSILACDQQTRKQVSDYIRNKWK
ncbi:MAG: 1-deoxy-D-xylulose-5-phosphate reductoisomerase [Gammaproteobacteria bacterium]|tara:strand:- start:2421 stop:3611 length:1191 start_codon:yes stop_codon:yes gene_type:complete